MKPYVSIVSTVAILVLVALLAVPAVSTAQDFGQLLEAVDKLEAKLKIMIEQESKDRAKAIEQLMKSGNKGQMSNPDVQFAEFRSDLATMHEELSHLSDAITIERANGSEAGIHHSELASLRTEIEKLKRVLKPQPRLLASADDATSYALGIEPQLFLSQQESIQDRLEITGFFDAAGSFHGAASDETQFSLGQAEIHLDYYASDKTYIRITPVFDNNTNSLSLGPVYTKVIAYENNQSPISSISFSAGKMDIPFGISLLENAVINRKIQTRPKAPGLTHGYWGDYGFMLNFDLPFGNLVTYGVNGFASTVEVDSALSLSLGVIEGSQINTTPAYAFGARAGFFPVETFELGFSIASGNNESDRNEMVLLGTDLQYTINQFHLKGEYIYHSLNRSVAETNNRGYYLEGRLTTGQVTFASRYGSFRTDGQPWDGRFAIAASYDLTGHVNVQFETLFNKNSDENTSGLHFVASF